MPDQDKNQEPKNQGTSPDASSKSITVEIDGQPVTKTAEDIANLIAQQASATQKTQQVAAVMQAAEKFGLNPEDYVNQAEGAFAVVSDLIDRKIIDEKGNIIAKDPSQTQDKTKHREEPRYMQSQDPPKETSELAKRLEIIEKALGNIERDQTQMIRMDLQRQIQSKHENLSAEDVSKLFGLAMNDRSKSVWQHAEELAKHKDAHVAELRKKHAEEFGVDLDKFEANKLQEQDAEGGAAAFFKGKKFSFKRGDKDAISPKQATMEFFKKINQ